MSTGILIVSYRRDHQWLRFCLMSIRKYTSGFSGVTVVVPQSDEVLFQPLCQEFSAELKAYQSVEGRGRLEQQVVKCHGDIHRQDDFICHLDSDCLFKEPSTPDDFFADGKPILPMQSYEDLLKTSDPKMTEFMGFYGRECDISGARHLWQLVTFRALGFLPPNETMWRHPAVHYRWLYPAMRSHMESLHGVGFSEWVFRQKASYPEGFSEFNALGAYAHRFHNGDYHWVDVFNEPHDRHPKQPLRQFWSHGGVEAAIDEIKQIIDL